MPRRQPAWDRLVGLTRELDPGSSEQVAGHNRHPISLYSSPAPIIHRMTRLGFHRQQLKSLLRDTPDGGPSENS